MKKNTRIKSIAPIVPYISIFIGIYIFTNAWIAILLYHFGIVLFLILDRKRDLLKNILSGWNPPVIVISILVFALSGPVIFLFWPYMNLGQIDLKISLINLSLHGLSFYLFVLYFSLIQPLMEELFWRSYLGSNLKYPSWQDFAFGGYHILVLIMFIKLPWVILSFLVLCIVAWIWRRATNHFGGVVVPLLSHAAGDMSIIVVINILVQ